MSTDGPDDKLVDAEPQSDDKSAEEGDKPADDSDKAASDDSDQSADDSEKSADESDDQPQPQSDDSSDSSGSDSEGTQPIDSSGGTDVALAETDAAVGVGDAGGRDSSAPFSPFPPKFSDPLTFNTTSFSDPIQRAFEGAMTAARIDPSFDDLPDVHDIPIAIVALNDTSHPYAGQNEFDMYYSGSMLKIAAMYAAFQLREAVNQFAANLGASATIDTPAKFFSEVRRAFDSQILNAADLINAAATTGHRAPLYDRILTATQGAQQWTVAFRSDTDPKFDFAGHLKNMIVDSHNPSAGFCIQALGFSWIDGLLQKVGLFDPSARRGIWLAGDYLLPQASINAAHAANVANPDKGDPDGVEEFNLGISGWSPVRIPSKNDGPSKQATTCIDAARLLVLLADRKLVGTDGANTEMLEMLHDGVTGAAPSIVKGFPPTEPPPTFTISQAKIGVGTLGTTGNCNPDAHGNTKGCVLSESMIVKQAAAPHRQFVVVWQNVQDSSNRGYNDIKRIRNIIQKTMDDFNP